MLITFIPSILQISICWWNDCLLSECSIPNIAVLISRTKLAENQLDLTSNQHAETLKQKIMKLRRENEVLKRRLNDENCPISSRWLSSALSRHVLQTKAQTIVSEEGCWVIFNVESHVSIHWPYIVNLAHHKYIVRLKNTFPLTHLIYSKKLQPRVI